MATMKHVAKISILEWFREKIFSNKQNVKMLKIYLDDVRELPKDISDEMTANHDLIAFLTKLKFLKMVSFSESNLEKIMLSEPIFKDSLVKNAIIQTENKIKSISFRNGLKTTESLIACLYESDLINVYQVLRLDYLLLYKQYQCKNVCFIRWCHLAVTQNLLIVCGRSQRKLINWEIMTDTQSSYKAESKIIDFAWSNGDEFHKYYIAVSTTDHKIILLDQKFKLLFEFSERRNQKIIFLKGDYLFTCGKKALDKFRYKIHHLDFQVSIYECF